MQAAYPVGSIYINAAVSTNPAALLGFGTWTEFGAGRVMVGFNSSDALFDTLEETGGSKDAVVVSHTHSITDPSHSHTFTGYNEIGGGGGGLNVLDGPNGKVTSAATTGISINTTGVSGTNANVQPYITVRMWKRTA